MRELKCEGVAVCVGVLVRKGRDVWRLLFVGDTICGSRVVWGLCVGIVCGDCGLWGLCCVWVGEMLILISSYNN